MQLYDLKHLQSNNERENGERKRERKRKCELSEDLDTRGGC